MSRPSNKDPVGRRSYVVAIASLAYVAFALLMDNQYSESVLAWDRLAWINSSGADIFKFTVWFLIPFAFTLRGMDFQYFTFARWKKIDWSLLAAVAGIGAAVMLVLPHIPGVGEYYGGWGRQPVDARIDRAVHYLVWTASWLIGWEFMHRYLLPRAFARFEGHGLLFALAVIPALEGFYHVIQEKPHLESLGMAALSFVLTAWTLRRRNCLLPFLGHLIIEIELVAYLFFSD